MNAFISNSILVPTRRTEFFGVSVCRLPPSTRPSPSIAQCSISTEGNSSSGRDVPSPSSATGPASIPASLDTSSDSPSSQPSPSPPPPVGDGPVLPVHFRIPIFGVYIDQIVGRPAPVLARMYGPVYRTDVFGMPAIVVNDLLTMKDISKDTNFTLRGAWPDTAVYAIGDKHLSNLDGYEHKVRRATMQPIFSSRAILRSQRFVRQSALTAFYRASRALDGKAAGVSMPLEPFIKQHFMDSIIMQTTGDNFNTQELDEVKRCLGGIMAGLFLPLWLPKGRATYECRKDVLSILRELIRDTFLRNASVIDKLRVEHDTSDVFKSSTSDIMSGNIDLLTVLCATTSISTKPEYINSDAAEGDLNYLADLILFLWWAGSETSTALTLSCIMRLHASPETLPLLLEEQHAMARGDEDADPDETNVKKELERTPVMAAFIEEVLRMNPPVALYMRIATQDSSVLGYKIKKGEKVCLDVLAAHTDPRYYENPETFDINRFRSRSVPTSLAFGEMGSIHICIGNIMARFNVVTTLSALLRNYEFEFDQKQQVAWSIIPDVRPKSGVKLTKLTPRKLK